MATLTRSGSSELRAVIMAGYPSHHISATQLELYKYLGGCASAGNNIYHLNILTEWSQHQRRANHHHHAAVDCIPAQHRHSHRHWEPTRSTVRLKSGLNLAKIPGTKVCCAAEVQWLFQSDFLGSYWVRRPAACWLRVSCAQYWVSARVQVLDLNITRGRKNMAKNGSITNESWMQHIKPIVNINLNLCSGSDIFL